MALTNTENRPLTIAVVDAGGAADARDAFVQVRQASGAAEIFALMDGDLDRAGGLAGADKYARAAALRAAGASCVVEMPLQTQLLPDNLYAFSVEAMLRKLGCVDLLALPCAGPREVFQRTADFLFDEPAPYRDRMRGLRDGGADLDAVFAGVVGDYVPGAAAFLARPQNRLAVAYLNALKRAYSTVRTVWLPRETPPAAETEAAARRDAFLLRRAAAAFRGRPEREAVAWAADIFSGSERMARRVYDLLGQTSADGLRAFSREAACADMNPVAVRRYLLSCLAGYRKVDGFVCITYNYVPCVRVLSAAPAALERLRRTAGTTLIVDTEAEKDFSRVTDVYKRLLLEMDARVRRLFLESEAAES